MHPTIIHIHTDAPPKPAWGAPCNGCGLCCLSEPCPIGMLVSRKRHGICKALRWSDEVNRYVCGMLLAPAEVLGWPAQGLLSRWLAPWLARRSRRWIAAGLGCDAHIQALPQEPGP
ncbi:hypothetical protein HNP55_000629 [Paucibacter oligotrophus]|uniref:4Fe-4S ferredoxin-type domain-containing protein n=1 Tax=Roseateles oligotrophus TaxID=1769250 RepID=A0A840L121_9BURK|nr:hypothetical protein [Roseateles oligotrophus]MBB4842134.1 hypothetical protein [Roseateles oligotrophus]